MHYYVLYYFSVSKINDSPLLCVIMHFYVLYPREICIISNITDFTLYQIKKYKNM